MVNVRDSAAYRYQDCLIDAGNDIFAAEKCVRKYISQMQTDNDDLVKFYQAQAEHQKYLWRQNT